MHRPRARNRCRHNDGSISHCRHAGAQMSPWFRMYAEILDDPKVQRLSGDDFKGWVNLLCLALRNDGRLPAMEDVSFSLRRSLDDAVTLLERLRDAGLIDRLSGGADGSHDAPHSWRKRQYKSDTSTDRVKRFRERSETVKETPPEADTESDTDTENNGAKAPKPRAAFVLP